MTNKMTKKFKQFTAATMVLSTLGSIGISAVTVPLAYADDISVEAGMTNDQFINEIGPRAQRVAAENDLYASVMIAQAVLESGWGRSALSQAPNYNLFGIKGAYNGQTVGMNTTEGTGATAYGTSAEFRRYNSFDESLQDNADIVSGDTYVGAWKSNTSTYQDATNYLTGIYASDLEYASKLNNIIEKYDLTKYDVAPEGVEVKTETKVEIKPAEVKPDFETREVEEVKEVKYETQVNDSLWGIAREHQVSIDQLKSWNDGLKEMTSDKLPEKVELKVDEEKVKKEEAYKVITETKDLKYEVVAGDSVSKIAEAHKLSIDDVHSLNTDLRADNLIFPKQELKVGEETKTYDKILTDEEKAEAIKVAEEKAAELDRLATEAQVAKIAQDNKVETSDEANRAVAVTNPTISGEASADAKKLIEEAYKHIGKEYTQGPGRQGPNMFDCSGLTQYVFKTALGIEIGSWTVPQETSGTQISVAEAQPGDLYFWGGNGGTTHVALAIGNGEYIHAPTYGQTVTVGNTEWFTPSFAVRVLN